MIDSHCSNSNANSRRSVLTFWCSILRWMSSARILSASILLCRCSSVSSRMRWWTSDSWFCRDLIISVSCDLWVVDGAVDGVCGIGDAAVVCVVDDAVMVEAVAVESLELVGTADVKMKLLSSTLFCRLGILGADSDASNGLWVAGRVDVGAAVAFAVAADACLGGAGCAGGGGGDGVGAGVDATGLSFSACVLSSGTDSVGGAACLSFSPSTASSWCSSGISLNLDRVRRDGDRVRLVLEMDLDRFDLSRLSSTSSVLPDDDGLRDLDLLRDLDDRDLLRRWPWWSDPSIRRLVKLASCSSDSVISVVPLPFSNEFLRLVRDLDDERCLCLDDDEEGSTLPSLSRSATILRPLRLECSRTVAEASSVGCLLLPPASPFLLLRRAAFCGDDDVSGAPAMSSSVMEAPRSLSMLRPARRLCLALFFMAAGADSGSPSAVCSMDDRRAFFFLEATAVLGVLGSGGMSVPLRTFLAILDVEVASGDRSSSLSCVVDSVWLDSSPLPLLPLLLPRRDDLLFFCLEVEDDLPSAALAEMTSFVTCMCACVCGGARSSDTLLHSQRQRLPERRPINLHEVGIDVGFCRCALCRSRETRDDL
mmetsp:Transcript_18338/g.52353  ORF Transcript_18338/g.52353 Transcript_18338/m.52353 type:complete len:595 (+) Transcript_18338:408-2192(+)